jgi:xanthine/uracil/vitamin C permease (AzgA family)
MLEQMFALRARGATVGTEVLADVMTALLALATNYPLTMASCMGLNAKVQELSLTLLIVALVFLVYFVEPWLVHVLAVSQR